jgi:hypothetical protein
VTKELFMIYKFNVKTLILGKKCGFSAQNMTFNEGFPRQTYQNTQKHNTSTTSIANLCCFSAKFLGNTTFK